MKHIRSNGYSKTNEIKQVFEVQIAVRAKPKKDTLVIEIFGFCWFRVQ